MRRAVIVAVLLGALASGARAGPGTIVVYPTGEYPADVESVQTAVDQGGKVLLKATSAGGAPTAFDFGPPLTSSGFVTLDRDVELVGEHSKTGPTTVVGGFFPVRSFTGATTAVRGIDFEGPLYGAILSLGESGADTEITGNRIAHVVGTFPEAIAVSGGRVVVNDNVVEDVGAVGSIGISEFDAAGKVEILRNRVSGTSFVAIECSRNQGVVKILHNLLRPGPTSDGVGGYGIEVNGTGAYDISRNDILVETPGGVGISALGIVEFGFGPLTDPVIEQNHVALRPVGDIDGELFDDGIDLSGLASGAAVRENKIDGPGYTALGLYDLSLAPEHPSDLGFNRFVDNHIARFHAAFADVFLDVSSHDNLVKGPRGTAIDLGTNNHLVGFTRITAEDSTVSLAAQARSRAADIVRRIRERPRQP